MSILYAVIYDTGIMGVVRYVYLERAAVITAYINILVIKPNSVS